MPFTIMSVSKPFVFALVCDAIGPDAARQKIGVNATGLAFNALAAIERDPDGRTNPMVNPGAIAATSLIPGADLEARWTVLSDGLTRFAGRALMLDEEVLAARSRATPATGRSASSCKATGGSKATRRMRSSSIPGNARRA